MSSKIYKTFIHSLLYKFRMHTISCGRGYQTLIVVVYLNTNIQSYQLRMLTYLIFSSCPSLLLCLKNYY